MVNQSMCGEQPAYYCQLVADYADVDGADHQRRRHSDDSLFRSLVFVMRDWQDDYQFGEDATAFDEIVSVMFCVPVSKNITTQKQNSKLTLDK